MNPLIEIALAILVMAMAFVVGFAIRRGSICMVAASRMLVVEGRPMRLRAFALAGAVSALAIIPLAWISGNPEMLSPNYGVTGALLIAGCGFGLGAMINGGCAFGTLARLSGGQVEYAASIAATVAGAMVAMSRQASGQVLGQMSGQLDVAMDPGSFAEPGWPGIAMLALSALLIWPALSRSNWHNLVSTVERKKTLLRPTTAMLVIGLLSGLLFALAGSWSHLAALGQEGEALIGRGRGMANVKAVSAAIALVSGALFAAYRSGRFKLEMPNLIGLIRRTIGGGIMGYSAATIPGGNGALLTFGLPSGAASAWAAFACMSLTLVLLFVPVRLMKQRTKATEA